MASKKKIYEYGDGSGNSYTITSENKYIMEFKPVKPEFSSSGIYDGGEHIKKEISKQQYDNITKIIDEAVSNDQSHVKDRVKMSGMITIKEGNDRKTCILSPTSKEKEKIEKFLQELKEK